MSNNPFLYTNRDMSLGQRAVRGIKDASHNAGRSIANALVMAPWKLVNQIFNPDHPVEWIKSRHAQRMEARSQNGFGRTLADFQLLSQIALIKEIGPAPLNDELSDADGVSDSGVAQAVLKFSDALHQENLVLVENFQKQADAGHQKFMGEVADLETHLDNLIEKQAQASSQLQSQANELKSQLANQAADLQKQLDVALDKATKEASAMVLIGAKLPPGLTRSYLASAYTNGFPRLVQQGATELNNLLIDQLQQILEKCQDGSPEADLVFSDLASGFVGCQATQQRTVAEVYQKIQDGQYEGKSFSSVLSVPFKNLNGHVLDRTIETLYPQSTTASDATPHLQFEHVKMGFLAALGDQLKLGDATMLGIAKSDPHRYKPSALEVDQFMQEFAKKFEHEQVKFLTDMANQLNDPTVGASNAGSAYLLWVNDPSHPARAAKFASCFYDEDTHQDYPGLSAPTSDQEDMSHFYFSPDDVITMLDEMGGLDLTAKEGLKASVALSKQQNASASLPVSPIVAMNSKQDKESSIKSSLAALIMNLEKSGESFRRLKTASGVDYSVTLKKEGGKQIVTVQDSEGFDTAGFAGVWCSLMLPDNTLRVNKQDIKDFDDQEKLKSVLKAIELFGA